jgi:hypothetical protein
MHWRAYEKLAERHHHLDNASAMGMPRRQGRLRFI